jgi:hypothetical protein
MHRLIPFREFAGECPHFMSPRYFFMNSLCEFPFSKGRAADDVVRQHPRTRFVDDADDLVYSSVEGMEQSHAGALSVWPQYNGQSYTTDATPTGSI